MKLDGTTLQTINEPAAADIDFTRREVDLSSFMDGADHDIRFEYDRPAGSSPDNFTIDDVSLQFSEPTPPSNAMFDFDGDGKSDESVFRPASGVWYLNRSQAGFTGYQFGVTGDVITPADFTGDGKTDVAVFRPAAGAWFVLKSEDNTFYGGAIWLQWRYSCLREISTGTARPTRQCLDLRPERGTCSSRLRGSRQHNLGRTAMCRRSEILTATVSRM